ncbi:MAG: cation:proton antiporter [Myxococcota bacterium]
MDRAHDFLHAVTVVLAVAGLTSVLFRRLKQPVVLGYLLAGLIVGPYVPIPLVADPEITHALAELGVILLMFSLGLEFSLRQLVKVAPNAGLTALFETSAMSLLGFAAARLLGFSGAIAPFLGAMIAISSTTIVVRTFAEQGVEGRLRSLVLGVLIVEDLIAVLLIASLTAIEGGLDPAALLRTLGRLAAFLLGFALVGLWLIPRAMRVVERLGHKETLLVASVGLCFLGAFLADAAGYSVALGAFVAGSLAAESGVEKEIEHQIAPVRDVFGAIFFVAVGMQLDPRVVLAEWPLIAAFTVLVVLGKIAAVSLGAFLLGNGVQTSVRAGMSLAQVGELSFIIAGMAGALGPSGKVLMPVAVSVSAITTLTTPWLVRASGGVVERLDRALPRRLQTLAALYTAWIEQLRAPRAEAETSATRRQLRWLLLDAGVLWGLLLSVALLRPELRDLWTATTGLEGSARELGLTAAILVVSMAPAIGIARLSQGLAERWAQQALGSSAHAAAERALTTTLQLGLVLAIGVPTLAFTQPFGPSLEGPAVLAALALFTLISLWRRAARLEGELRAGSLELVSALADRARGDQDSRPVPPLPRGLVEPVAVVVPAGSAAVDRSLGELDLRGRTGATVVAIVRAGGEAVVADAKAPLRAGDLLAVVGSSEAVAALNAAIANPR